MRGATLSKDGSGEAILVPRLIWKTPVLHPVDEPCISSRTTVFVHAFVQFNTLRVAIIVRSIYATAFVHAFVYSFALSEWQ